MLKSQRRPKSYDSALKSPSVNTILNQSYFYVLLTVHLSIILVTDQLNAQILVLQ